MKKKIFIAVITILLGYPSTAQKKEKNIPVSPPLIDGVTADQIFDYTKNQFSLTQGSVTIEGKTVPYEAKTGVLVLKNAMDTAVLSMSYVAYFRSGVNKDTRPLTFLYNGGPGSSTIWLHMGCFGPQKVDFNEHGRTMPPFRTVNNNYSILDISDLVFIDAPGTGFGEVVTKLRGGAGEGKDFFGIDQDGRAFVDFIEEFISQNERWNSPKYLFGESYGTFRSAVMAPLLQQRGIALNGVMLLSQLLSYSNMSELAASNTGVDLPYVLLLPSLTATSWYHHKLPGYNGNLENKLKEVEGFALSDYTLALSQGAALNESSFHNIARKLHEYTGLDQELIEKANLRISGPLYESKLLSDSSQVTGRLDSRFKGDAYDPLDNEPGYDPMNSYISAVFTSTFNTYVREILNFGKGLKYKRSGNVSPWDFRRKGYIGFPNVMNDLAQAMIYDPELKVQLHMGYFDLGTPYFEGIFEMQHLPMPKALQKNIQYEKYKSGHMVYLHEESHKQLRHSVKKFIESSYKTGQSNLGMLK